MPYQQCPHCRRKNQNGELCSERCRSAFYFDQLLVCCEYKKGELLMKIITAFKYKFAKEFAPFLGELLSKKLKTVNDFSTFRIIPIPIHKKRFKFRGFNQTLILSEFLAEKLQIPVMDCLERNIFHQSQASSSKSERMKNLRDSISIKEWGETAVKNRTVLLVDDVATTCSTLNECAKVLKKSGVKNIISLVLARGK